ncbi:MAG: RNA polymerase sigma factor [Thermoanaerobaculia bacterium]
MIGTYGRGVAILLDRHTNGRPEAEDLFQDTFRLVIEKLRRGELREPAKLPGFLAQIARSLAIEHYRKAQRRKTDPDSDAIAEAVDLSAGGSGALAELLSREDAGLVRRVIGDLGTERDREILLRFYIAEEDRERIQADLGLSSLQFNRVLHRARERYRDLYLERIGGRRAALLFVLGIILLLVPLSLGGRRTDG